MKPDLREMLDIAYVRRKTNTAHVSDEDALAAFSDGRGVFDVDLHCRKLDAFVARHKIEAWRVRASLFEADTRHYRTRDGYATRPVLAHTDSRRVCLTQALPYAIIGTNRGLRAPSRRSDCLLGEPFWHSNLLPARSLRSPP